MAKICTGRLIKPAKRSICNYSPFFRRICLRCHSFSSKYHKIQHNQRPCLVSRWSHISKIIARTNRSWMESQENQENTKLLCAKRCIQQMELQQAPNMAANWIWQSYVHRFWYSSFEKSRWVLPISTNISSMEWWAFIQFRAYANWAIRMYF